MFVTDLNREQLIELKQAYLCDIHAKVSYSDLADADTIVSDREVFKHYSGYSFTDDDFFCSAVL